MDVFVIHLYFSRGQSCKVFDFFYSRSLSPLEVSTILTLGPLTLHRCSCSRFPLSVSVLHHVVKLRKQPINGNTARTSAIQVSESCYTKGAMEGSTSVLEVSNLTDSSNQATPTFKTYPVVSAPITNQNWCKTDRGNSALCAGLS